MKHTSLELNLDEWINASLEGKLNEAEQREFDHYLAAHPEAREAYEETQAMNRLLEKTLKKDQPDPGFEERMVNRFRNKKRSQDLGFWKNWASLWQGQKTVYAGAVAALVLSFYLGGLDEPKPKDYSMKSGLFTPPPVVMQNNGTTKFEVVQDFRYPDPNGYRMSTTPLENVDRNWDESFGADPNKDANTTESITRNGTGTLVLNGGSTYTGGTTITAGTLQMNESGETKKDEALKSDNNFDGFINYGEPITPTEKGAVGLKPGGLLVPVFSKKVAASAGQTEVEKSVVAPEDRAAGAKVPILGDIPVVGRAFANQSDQKLSVTNGALTSDSIKMTAGKTVASTANLGVVQENISRTPASEAKAGEVQKSGAPASTEIHRKLIRNADIGMEVKSYAAAVRDLTRLAQDEKGFVATQNDRTQANGHTAGQVVIKLPPDRLDEFVLRLRELGTVQRQVLKMDDVTKAYFDTEARLRNARKTEERLLELMAKKTDKVADLLQVEKEIGRVRESIEQMQGELKLWDSLASLATVTIDLVEQDMDQAAAYLLKETATLGLYSTDVEKSYGEARALAEKSEAQIVTAQVNRSADGQMNATLSLLAAPDKAFLLIEQLKGLGRVQSFVQDTQRVAQDGRSGIAGTTRKDKVEIQVSIVHDDASRKTVAIQIVTPEVEKALDQCKKAALGSSGEILASNLQRDTNGHSRAVLTVRLPAKNLEATKAVFASQGRTAKLSVNRNDETGANLENEDSSPVILALTLADEEPPVQITRLDIEGGKVAAKVEELKNRARILGVEIRASSFVRSPNGIEQANLVFRMTQKEYAGMLESLLATGKTLNMALERSDRIDSEKTGEANEPVEVQFRMKSPSPLVEDQNGFVGAVKHTLAKSFHVLGGSLQRIVTGFAYLLPWLLLGGLGLWVWKKWRGKKSD